MALAALGREDAAFFHLKDRRPMRRPALALTTSLLSIAAAAQVIKFDMSIIPLERKGLFQTSRCPVVAKGHGFEMWHEPILHVLLAGARLMRADEPMACKN